MAISSVLSHTRLAAYLGLGGAKLGLWGAQKGTRTIKRTLESIPKAGEWLLDHPTVMKAGGAGLLGAWGYSSADSILQVPY